MELNSPSRRDGISLSKETQLCSQYSYIRHLGSKLRLPHLAIVKALVFCHRFYARQSFAKNDWHAVATACVLLAIKVEESPRFLKDVVNEAYRHEIQDYVADQMLRSTINLHDMRERDEFFREKGRVTNDQKKELIIAAEGLVLRTMGFDLNVQLPYKTLVAALHRLREEKITGSGHPQFTKVACSLVEDLLRTSLCLRYEPQFIAVGSVVVAASVLKMKLPANKKWLEGLDVPLKELNEVIQSIQRKFSK
ncbi:cyclin-T1-4-like [Argentina anserina]|uniref:cyclin-T1-4-like n=1 Tax=Argentina anserina TaxID=57926 RepID=UPI0021762CB4|nr:cyclin-T1-4-like [Potentilla anserina]